MVLRLAEWNLRRRRHRYGIEGRWPPSGARPRISDPTGRIFCPVGDRHVREGSTLSRDLLDGRLDLPGGVDPSGIQCPDVTGQFLPRRAGPSESSAFILAWPEPAWRPLAQC